MSLFRTFLRGLLFGFVFLPVLRLWNIALSFPQALIAFLLTCMNNLLLTGKAAYDENTMKRRRSIANAIGNAAKKIYLLFCSYSRKDVTIPVDDKESVVVTFIRSKDYENKNLPVLFFIHGGGWCHNFEVLYMPAYHDLIKNTNVCVCYINYRMAPEYKHPIPIDDCEKCIKYIHKHSEEYYIIPELSYIIGDSAGGMIAANVVDRFAKQRYEHQLRIQVQVYPANDNRMLSNSDAKYGINYGLTNYHMGVFVGYYFHSIDEYCSVSGSPCIEDETLTSDLPFPATCVFTNEYDICRDGGYEYAEKLKKLHFNVEYQELEGAVHGSWCINPTKQIINNHVIDILLNILYNELELNSSFICCT